MSNPKQDFINLTILKLNGTSRWRAEQAKRFPSDNRNKYAAQTLASFATEAKTVPDHIWDEIEPRFHWSNEAFGEALSLTNRGIQFRDDAADIAAYWESVASNVRLAFEVA